MICAYCHRQIDGPVVHFRGGPDGKSREYHALENEKGEHVQDVHDPEHGACWAKSKQGTVSL